jgi:hypothetical protein
MITRPSTQCYSALQNADQQAFALEDAIHEATKPLWSRNSIGHELFHPFNDLRGLIPVVISIPINDVILHHP